MKKYYIHLNNKQEGPFSIDELKNLTINSETLVWYEGAEDWQNASKIEELKEIFKTIPPPIPKTVPPLNDKTLKPEENKNISSSKKWKLAIIAIIIVLITGLGLFILQNNKQEAIQKQLEEQNAIILEQQKVNAQKEAEEQQKKAELEKKQREEELAALKIEYDNAITSLRFAKEKLEQIKQFQLLRTPDEKAAQIKDQLEVIRDWENEVDRINTEINKY